LTENYKYIVIGGGIAGLHIGALLSQHGKTLILEKAKELGGRARVVDIDKFKLDFGAHPIRFGPNSALGQSLKEIGKPIDFIKPGNFWCFLKDGTRTIFPAGGISQIRKSSMVPFMKTLKLMIKIKKKMTIKDFEALYGTSLEEWMEEENLIPELRRYLIITSSGVQVNPFPERSSAGELLHNIRRILEKGSIQYPKGGWGEIFRRFKEKISENGEIMTNAEVSEIIIENNRAIGVKLEDKIIYGNNIISTIPVQQLFTILDENLCEKTFVEKCKTLRPTAGIAIDFCLSKPIIDIDFWFYEVPLAFGFVPSNLSPEVAPEGKQIINFFMATNVEDIKNKNKADELYHKFRDIILQSIPELGDEKVVLQERPLFLEMVDGVEVNIYQHRFKRPGNTIEGIENLWLTGDSCGGEGAGGDVGHTSVRECYLKILNKK